ncbi:hypothetical protein B0B25_31395, partial [Pseudomonas aeruginosa]|uniref:helix-turn-helix domain-containing protein n=1 Tax=Pseudomonas aeruginosa TaxID=287 RepID=UPI0009CD6E70
MESTYSNAAAIRAFRVIEAVTQQPDGCTLAGLVERLALPKQTLHRLVEQLEMAGLLVREPGTRRLQAADRIERLAVDTLM